MPRNVRSPLVAAAACAAALGLLAFAAYRVGPVRDLDLRIVLHFEHTNLPAFFPAGLLVHLGDLGSVLALTVVICLLGLSLGRTREVALALAVVAGANITTQVLKVALEHTRHTFYEPGIELPWTSAFPSANSFPSGHTTAAASLAVALLLVVPARHRMSAAATGLLFSAAVAISVVVLDWHYPTDVLGGLLIAAAWGFLALAALRLSSRREKAADSATPTVRTRLAVFGD